MKKNGIWCCILIGVFAAFLSHMSCEAAENKVVKVAYYALGDYYSEEENGSVVSYDTDFLKKVSNYTGLKFEFVDCGNWSNALTMLKDHQVDLVGTVQWNAQREEAYEFCQENYGYTIGELATLPDHGIVYEDYQAIDAAVVGCTKAYVRKAEMEHIFQEQGIDPVIRTYDDQSQLEKALESGEIDIIAANSHAIHPDWEVVERKRYIK